MLCSFCVTRQQFGVVRLSMYLATDSSEVLQICCDEMIPDYMRIDCKTHLVPVRP